MPERVGSEDPACQPCGPDSSSRDPLSHPPSGNSSDHTTDTPSPGGDNLLMKGSGLRPFTRSQLPKPHSSNAHSEKLAASPLRSAEAPGAGEQN